MFDSAWSLGKNCDVASNLRRYGYLAGPLDWMDSTIQSIASLIDNNFRDFMIKENLTPLNKPYGKHCYTIKDNLYGILSVHDFPLDPPNFLEGYDTFKAKINRRIKRFISAAQEHTNILFVRSEAPGEDVNYKQIKAMLESLDRLRQEKPYRLLYIYRRSQEFPIHPNVSYFQNRSLEWKTSSLIWDMFFNGN